MHPSSWCMRVIGKLMEYTINYTNNWHWLCNLCRSEIDFIYSYADQDIMQPQYDKSSNIYFIDVRAVSLKSVFHFVVSAIRYEHLLQVHNNTHTHRHAWESQFRNYVQSKNV